MEKMFIASMFFWLVVMVFSFLLSGCGEPIPCTKPSIQIADMSHNYKHCKGLHYEGKE